MSIELYYTPPPQESFVEIQRKAIEIWQTYDDTCGYATEKINRIKDLNNVSDNFMYIFSMFDSSNQNILLVKLTNETKYEIKDRLN